MILTHTVDIERETRGGNKLSFVTLIESGLKVNIQPADNETTIINEGAFGRTYRMYGTTSVSGVMESDRVTVTSGTMYQDKKFIVKGRKNWIMGGPLDHMEFILFESNE
jgi:hypothetical protein